MCVDTTTLTNTFMELTELNLIGKYVLKNWNHLISVMVLCEYILYIGKKSQLSTPGKQRKEPFLIRILQTLQL